MAVFTCDRCGKCCVSFGPLIRIERQMSDRDYYCRCVLDNTVFLAHVDSTFAEEIADDVACDDTPVSGAERKSCIFMRKDGRSRGFACAIFSTRPKICRDFRCYRMLVYDRDGLVCGRVIGQNILRTKDATLVEIWQEKIAPIPYADAEAWTAKVIAILSANAYRGEPVE
jgi:Fe-S-cluster containining protein